MSTTAKRSDAAYRRKLACTNRWKKKNKKRVAAYNKQWHERNREHRSAYNKKYHQVSGKNTHLKKTYGITEEQWDELFAAQGSSCAICHTTEKPKTGWHTDHCHETGKVRGILCGNCNWMLGNAKDNTNTLASAISYLKANHGAK